MPISHKKVGERDFLKVLSHEVVLRATGNGKRKKKNGHVNSNRRANESQRQGPILVSLELFFPNHKFTMRSFNWVTVS